MFVTVPGTTTSVTPTHPSNALLEIPVTGHSPNSAGIASVPSVGSAPVTHAPPSTISNSQSTPPAVSVSAHAAPATSTAAAIQTMVPFTFVMPLSFRFFDWHSSILFPFLQARTALLSVFAAPPRPLPACRLPRRAGGWLHAAPAPPARRTSQVAAPLVSSLFVVSVVSVAPSSSCASSSCRAPPVPPASDGPSGPTSPRKTTPPNAPCAPSPSSARSAEAPSRKTACSPARSSPASGEPSAYATDRKGLRPLRLRPRPPRRRPLHRCLRPPLPSRRLPVKRQSLRPYT